jgi:polyisoprenyl-phosphate glycosyltransferase
MENNIKLSIIVPCFNEESCMFELHRRITEVCGNYLSEAYELIFINDGSSDKTWGIICVLAQADKSVVGINLSRNFGHEMATSAGLQVSRGERIFVLDADLQDPPELLPQMMTKMDQGCDVVYGQRIKRQNETIFKKLFAHVFYRFLNKLIETRIPVDTGDFRLMSRKVVNILNKMPEHDRFVRGMVGWIGMRQEALPYERSGRFQGKTKYTFSKLIGLAIDAIIGFSTRPLRVASYFGILFGIFAIAFLVYVFYQYFTYNSVRGWASLVTIVLVLGSIQLFVIGLLGEYLGRLYMEAKGRPLFIIKEIVSAGEISDLKYKA